MPRVPCRGYVILAVGFDCRQDKAEENAGWGKALHQTLNETPDRQRGQERRRQKRQRMEEEKGGGMRKEWSKVQSNVLRTKVKLVEPALE